jgi:hypothetical protein
MAANGVSGPHGRDPTDLAAAVPQRVDVGALSFGAVLRALNPLQYLPVVGTIYRVATGDAAPSGLRSAVSVVAGVLTGGPIGLLGSVVGALAEQLFHIEDRMRAAVVGSPSAPTAVPASAGPVPTSPEVPAPPAADPPTRFAMVAGHAAYRAAARLA